MFEGVGVEVAGAASLSWQDSAACAALPDPSVMFPKGRVHPAARAACDRCPVFSLCRGYVDALEAVGFDRTELAGFVAGETPTERFERRRREAAARAAADQGVMV